jgi:peptidoglycan/LPS O-acetylase OafA/YrhL
LKARLLPLDALRGLAALGVALYHFQHFGGDRAYYPLASVQPFEWLYTRGWCLVDFFFLISGMVFTHTYMDAIADRTVSARGFFILRLSRIYPLHLATLLVCAILQWRMLWMGQAPIIYPKADLYHFVLNLFLLQNGTFEEGYSYNGASWSVATEVFAYVLFFWASFRFAKSYVVGAVIMLMLGMVTYHAHWSFPFLNETVARTLIGFFTGSLLFLGIRAVEVSGHAKKLGYLCLAVLAGVGVMAGRVGYDAFVGGAGYRTAVPHVLGVFPLVLAAALTLPFLRRALSLRPLTYLGDISYAIYLLHVPIQMAVLSVARAHGLTLPTNSAWMLVAFVGCLLLSAGFVHRAFEVPARGLVRKQFL